MDRVYHDLCKNEKNKKKKQKKENLTKKRYVASFFTPVCITLLLAVGCLEVIRLNGDEN